MACDFIQENEFLWRMRCREYHDVNKKKQKWDELAELLNTTREHVQGWWAGMRTCFGKLHNRKSGAAAREPSDRDNRILQLCSFYSVQIRHRSDAAPMRLVR